MLKITLYSILLVCLSPIAILANSQVPVCIDSHMLASAQRETYSEEAKVSFTHTFKAASEKETRDIGRSMGSEIRAQSQSKRISHPFVTAHPIPAYKASRVYPDAKQGADIIYIAKNADVDTFEKLTYIVSGYIEAAFAITQEQADIIAPQICYWNTNHYNQSSYFQTNFEERVDLVFANRTADIGLAPSYKRWAGKARIVIPTTDQMISIADFVTALQSEEPPVQETPVVQPVASILPKMPAIREVQSVIEKPLTTVTPSTPAEVDITQLPKIELQGSDSENPITAEQALSKTEQVIPKPVASAPVTAPQATQPDLQAPTEPIQQQVAATQQPTAKTPQLHVVQPTEQTTPLAPLTPIWRELLDNPIYTLLALGLLMLIILKIITYFSYI